MHEVAERTEFTFDELSEKAKDTARDKYRNDGHHYEWWDSTLEDAVTIAALLGIEIGTSPVKLNGGGYRQDPNIQFSGFGSQGDGACFQGFFNFPDKDPVAAVTEHCGEGDTELLTIATEIVLVNITSELLHGQKVRARIGQDGRYYHSGSMTAQVWFVDDSEDVPVELADDLEGLMRRFADWIYARLEAEDEYLNSDEYVDERLSDSDDKFDEDGHLV
jgi:hypothetical protein